MKKEEYLRKLKFQLIDLPGEDLEQIEDFYEELILDGIEQGYTEDEVIARLERPEDVAGKIRAEYGGLVVYTAKGKSKEEKQGYESVDQIHTVRVQSENMRIRIRTVESGPVRVLFQPREGQDLVNFKEEDGVFSFKHERKGNSYLDWISHFFDMQVLILELPMNFAGNLWIKTKNSSVSVSGLGNLSLGEFISNNGKIHVKNSHIEKLTVQANNGKIDLSNLMGNDMEASSGNGLITARECRFTDRLVLQTQNGAVTGKNLIGDHISMQTCNGFVTGNIIGNEKDYNIESSTKNGFNNLENVASPERSKTLRAKTHNGRIQIEFTL